jgi:DNA-binding transcriptional LysR family regulator
MLAEEKIMHGRLYASASISTMIPMILDGAGIGAIPSALVAAELRARKLRVLRVKNAPLPPLHYTASYPVRAASFVVPTVAELARHIAAAQGGDKDK